MAHQPGTTTTPEVAPHPADDPALNPDRRGQRHRQDQVLLGRPMRRLSRRIAVTVLFAVALGGVGVAGAAAAPKHLGAPKHLSRLAPKHLLAAAPKHLTAAAPKHLGATAAAAR